LLLIIGRSESCATMLDHVLDHTNFRDPQMCIYTQIFVLYAVLISIQNWLTETTKLGRSTISEDRIFCLVSSNLRNIANQVVHLQVHLMVLHTAVECILVQRFQHVSCWVYFHVSNMLPFSICIQSLFWDCAMAFLALAEHCTLHDILAFSFEGYISIHMFKKNASAMWGAMYASTVCYLLNIHCCFKSSKSHGTIYCWHHS